jgi:hypothetical protein
MPPRSAAKHANPDGYRNSHDNSDRYPNPYAYPMHGEMYANAAAASHSATAPVARRSKQPMLLNTQAVNRLRFRMVVSTRAFSKSGRLFTRPHVAPRESNHGATF